MEKTDFQAVAADLYAIKKLMILGLIQKGFKQGSIASILGISDAKLSLMFPKGALKEAKGLAEDD